MSTKRDVRASHQTSYTRKTGMIHLKLTRYLRRNMGNQILKPETDSKKRQKWKKFIYIAKLTFGLKFSSFFLSARSYHDSKKSSAWKSTKHTHGRLACQFNRPLIFLFAFCLARKKWMAFRICKTQQKRQLGCLAFRASSLTPLSHANTGLYVTHATITSGDECMKDYYGIAKKFFEKETLCSYI